jgi:nitrite reductase/ring-hydroxylating ferredoxin subunit
MMPPDVMQKLPTEMLAMFKRTGEILSEIEVKPLKTYEIIVRGESLYLETR